MAECRNLGEDFVNTNAWIEGGGCQRASDVIAQLKSVGDSLNEKLAFIREDLGKHPTEGGRASAIPPVPDQYTSAVTTDPFDSAFTAGVQSGGNLMSGITASGGQVAAVYMGIGSELQSLDQVEWMTIAGDDSGGKTLAASLKSSIADAINLVVKAEGLIRNQLAPLNAEFQEKVASDMQTVEDDAKGNIERYADQLARGLFNAEFSETAGGIFNLKTAFRFYDKKLGVTGKQRKARAKLAKMRKKADQIATAGIAALDKNENYIGSPFREQCFIQSNIFPLVRMRRSMSFPKKTQYPDANTQACLMAGGSPFGFINRLTQGPSTGALFTIPHNVLSALQPTVQLYKVTTTKSGELLEVPFDFPKSTTEEDVKNLLKNKKTRGYGVGMKSFTWTYDGSDPFSTKKSIKAQLKIHSLSFAELLRPRIGYAGTTFRYADLALKTGTINDRVPPACDSSTNDTIMDASQKLDFRLKAVVGYAIPRNLEIPLDKRKLYQRAIADAFVTLELTPTIHSFDFDEQGRVTFTIDYLAYIEDFFDDYYYNIFSSGDNNSIDAYKMRMQQRFDAATEGKKVQGYTPPNTDDEKALRGLQTKALNSITETLMKRDRIYYYQIPLKSLNQASIGLTLPVYSSSDSPINQSAVEEQIANLRKEARKQGQSTSEQARLLARANEIEANLNRNHLSMEESKKYGTDNNRLVTFFFLYDLVDVIMENIHTAINNAYPNALTAMKTTGKGEKVKLKETKTLRAMMENYKNLRVLLGPMEIANPNRKNEYMNISLGEIPISMKYYSEWMAEKILSRNRTGYTLSAFLNDFIKNYLRNFLNDNECGGDKFRQKLSLNNSSVSAYTEEPDYDPMTLLMLAVNKGREGNKQFDVFFAGDQLGNDIGALPFLNTMGSRIPQGPRSKGQRLQHNYMIFFAGRTRPDELMTGDWTADTSAGIHHYIMGQNNGIVKTIRLDRKAAKGLKELRFEQEGYDGLLQLREVYNVSINTFLLPNAFPGTYIFVDPRGFAPDTHEYVGYDPETGKPYPVDGYELSRYGGGGYYMITRSTHTIAEGVFDTSIDAAWVASKEKDDTADEEDEDATVEEESNPPKKCFAKKTPAAIEGGVADFSSQQEGAALDEAPPGAAQ